MVTMTKNDNRNSQSVDSIISFKNSQGLTSKGTLLTIASNTVVFEVYNPYSIVQLSEVLTELIIKRQGKPAYQGKAVVTNLVNTGLMLVVSVSLVEEWMGQLESLATFNSDVTNFIHDWETHRQLLPNFRLIVEEMRSFFSEFNRWLNVSQLPAGVSEGAEQRLDQVTEKIWPKWQDLLTRFEAEAAFIPEADLSIHKTFAQHNLHPLLLSAPFVHRVYTKPLGYAGDYEMINMILRNAYEGATDYAKIVHKLNILPPTPASVRNRNDIMLNYVVEAAKKAAHRQQPLRVLSIGCGPAVEIQRFIAQCPGNLLPTQIDIELLDFSEHTLQETNAKIAELMKNISVKNMNIHYIHESVHALLKNVDTDVQIRQYDLIYSGGLFDYLSDKVCTRLLKMFYKWLKPGGTIFTTNMHLCEPERFWMVYIFEWFLIYRDEKNLLDWVRNLGQQRVFADETGINLFLEIEKPE